MPGLLDNPLLLLGMGMMQGSQAGPQGQVPGLGAGFSQGLQMMLAAEEQKQARAIAQAKLNQLQADRDIRQRTVAVQERQQTQAESKFMGEQEQEAALAERRAAFAEGLPPEHQAIYAANPKAYEEAVLKEQFRGRSTSNVSGVGLVDNDTGKVIVPVRDKPTPDKPDSTFKAIETAEADGLVSAEEAALLKKNYIANLASKGTRRGIQVTVGEDGKLQSVSIGGDPVVKAPSGNRVDDLRHELASADETIDRISGLRKRLIDTPRLGGVVGLGSRMAVKAKGMISDLAALAGVDLGAGKVENLIAVDIAEGIAEPEVAKRFGAGVAEVEADEEALAYGIARLRKGSAKISNRDVDNALKEVRAVGAGDAQFFVDKLSTLEREMRAKRCGIRERFEAAGGEVPPTARKRFKFDPASQSLVPVE